MIVIVLLCFFSGISVGAAAMWMYLSHLWKKDASAFHAIIDGVTRLRKEK